MRNIYFILFFIVSNLSHSYENNQLLLNNQEKKINITPLETLDGNIVNLSDITTQKKMTISNLSQILKRHSEGELMSTSEILALCN